MGTPKAERTSAPWALPTRTAMTSPIWFDHNDSDNFIAFMAFVVFRAHAITLHFPLRGQPAYDRHMQFHHPNRQSHHEHDRPPIISYGSIQELNLPLDLPDEAVACRVLQVLHKRRLSCVKQGPKLKLHHVHCKEPLYVSIEIPSERVSARVGFPELSTRLQDLHQRDDQSGKHLCNHKGASCAASKDLPHCP